MGKRCPNVDTVSALKSSDFGITGIDGIYYIRSLKETYTMNKIPPRWWKPAPPRQEARPKFSAPRMEIKGNELVIVNGKTAG